MGDEWDWALADRAKRELADVDGDARDRIVDKLEEDLEYESAEAMIDDGRFDGQFNPMTTETLLREMDLEYDEEVVRISQIYQKARAIWKVDNKS